MVRWVVLAAMIVGTLGGGAVATPNGGCSTALIVSAKTGKVLRRLQLPVYSLVADGHGGWYAADTRLRHVHGNGSIDETWNSPVRRRLTYRMRLSAPGMLTRHGDRLYVAGRRRVVAVDAGTGRVLWLSPVIAGPTVAGWRATIAALAAGANAVYVGGTFTSIGGRRRVGLAALDATTGRLLPWQAQPVRAVALLALSSSRLYFSGSRIGAVRTSDGRPTSFVPSARIADPIMLAVWGRFVLIGCSSRWSICDTDSGVFEGRTGKAVHKYGFGEVSSAGAVAFAGSIAYLGTGPEGDFGGSHYLIAIDLRTGKFEPWFPKVGYYVTTTSIAVAGARVFVAGSFCPGP